MIDWSQVRWFKRVEFDSPDAPGSGDRMDPQLVGILDQIRTELGKPLIVTSGYRTLAHNAEVGGVSESEHCEGLAADVTCLTSWDRFTVVSAAIRYGVRRIGIGTTFVHLGMSRTLPTPRIWLY